VGIVWIGAGGGGGLGLGEARFGLFIGRKRVFFMIGWFRDSV
jgi:hypothetical protein